MGINMIVFLLILLVLLSWISLHHKIGRMGNQLDRLIRDMDELKHPIAPPTPTSPEPAEEPIRESIQEPIPEPDEEPVVQPAAAVIPPIIVIAEEEEKEEILPPPIPIMVAEIAEEAEEAETPPPLPILNSQLSTLNSFKYEKFIGENLFGKIGILVLVIGMGFFVKYAIDNNWINEVLRTILGFAVGAVLLGIAWGLRERYRAFSSVLAGGGFAIFYVTVAIAYHYYELFSQTGAFAILIALTALMALVSIWYDRRELAMIALIGGFLAPFLVSSGSDNYKVLFTYVMILDLGMLSLALYKKWGELPIACFALTWIVFGIYLLDLNFSTAGNVRLIHLQVFAVLFYLIFQASVAPVVRINRQRINQLLLIVTVANNFLFAWCALSLHGAMNNVQDYGGAITLFAALVNVATYWYIRRRGERIPYLREAFLWLALSFVSVTIPIQLNGSLITIFWAAELVTVMLLYTRFRHRAFEAFALLLLALTLISYGMDVENMFEWGASPVARIFFNGHFLTGILAGAAYLVSAFLLRQKKEDLRRDAFLKYTPFNALCLIVGTVVIYLAFIVDFYLFIDQGIFAQTLMRTFTIGVLLLLAWLFHERFPVRNYIMVYVALLAASVIIYGFLSASVNHSPVKGIVLLRIFQWGSLLILAAHCVYLAGMYYRGRNDRESAEAKLVTLFLGVLSTALLVITTNNLLSQFSLPDEANAAFSIALGVAAFVQMTLGMRLHLKTLRLLSLITFGLVLFKLVVIDLWLMPTIGKIIVFILLGILLLVLSFLYQKLKAALFGEEEEEVKREE